MKKVHKLTDRDVPISTKIYPYYCEEQLRMMTNDDITNRLILLKEQKDKFGADVNALNNEMQELIREVEKRANKKSKSKKTVVFDFDGVIHSYKSGWKGATIITDEPVEGIKETIDTLREDFKVVIVSTRCFQEGGIAAINAWLEKYKIVVDDVLGEKPPAIVYVDDRAICFNGKTEGLVNEIKSFKNWIELER